MDNKIVTARFATDDNYVNVYDVYQWDYGQVLRIEGLKLPNMVEIHFSLQETSGEAKTRIGVTKDGVTDVVIPDSFLENEGIGDNYKIFVWVYVADKESGSTEYKITIHVKVRAKPEITHGGQDGEVFQEAVEAVRGAAKRAAESEKQAERWAVGRVDVPGAETDNSKFYAEESKKNAQQTTKDKEAVEELVKKTENIGQFAEEVKANAQKASESAKNAETSATNASASEKNAKTSESNASTSETNAKASETNAKASEQAVEESKQAVDKAVADFGQAVTDASATLKAEKDAHVKAITTTGTTETKKVTDEGAKQVEMVQSIGTQETEKVTAEGTKQVGLVKTEGEKHLAAVQTAAQEIIADREQIAKNKTDIADLRQKKADAIVETANGTLLNVKDSSGAFFEDFSMSGKTTQDGTPTPDTPVPIVNAGESGNIEVKVVGKNILDVETATPKGWNLDITNLSNFEAGRTYTMTVVSLNDSSCGLFLDDHNKLVTYLNPGQSASFVMPDKSTFTKMSLCGGTETALLKDRSKVKVQIELGDKPTAYEPYKEPQTLTLQLDRPLTKWDRIEKREGIWGIVRQGETKVLKAAPEEEWATWEDKQNAFFIMNDKIIKEGLCSHFEAKGSFEIGKETGIYLFETIHLIVTDINIDSLEDWKTWLQANPIAVAYKIAEETWEPLPEEMQSVLNALHTNYPTTVVTNSENVNMQLTYVADTKNYYLNREQTIQKQILEIQNALISQKISGGGIKVTNSAKLPIVKLSVFGKSEQVQTTGAQLLNYYKLAELSPQYYVIEQGELKVKGSDNAAWTSVPEYDTLAAGTYTISGNNIEIRDASKNTVIATCIGDTFSKFTLNEDTAIKIKVGYGLDKYPIVAKAMLNKGDSKKPYEPYTGGKPSPSIEYPQEITNCGENGTINLEIAGDNAEPQTLIIPTPNGLLGLKVDVNGNYTDENGQQWICDEIDLARGKYVQRIRKIVLDGNIDTKHVGQHENGTKYLGIILQEKDYTLKASNMLCTRYIRAEWTNKNGYVYSAKKDTVFITDNRFTDSETTKKIIGEEKPVIIYPLLTPIETDLPPETIAAFKQLHTNYPTTLISNNADAGMELTYTVDTQSYIDSKIAEINMQIVNTQKQLLQERSK